MYSGIYTEHVDVNKELTIISQSGNPEDAILWLVGEEGYAFNVTANNVTISGFRLVGDDRNGINLDGVQYNNISNNELYGCGVYLNCSSSNTLHNNIWIGGMNTVIMKHSDNNLIINNKIWAHEYAVSLKSSDNNIVTRNNIAGSENCLELDSSSNNMLSNNSMEAWVAIDLHSFSNNNTVKDNYVSVADCAIIVGSSNNNVIYNNYFNSNYNAYDNGNNIWNITRTPGINIIGGSFLGGNYWSDYEGIDTDWDGLGNTLLPYNSSGQIVNGGDYLPLVTPSGPAQAIQATFDIDPEVLDLKSKSRWIKAYIELPDGYDVNDIDVSTILLTESISAKSVPSKVGDYDKDGTPDLRVMFDIQKLLPLLTTGDVEITVTGELTDGTMFEGTDTIQVLTKVK